MFTCRPSHAIRFVDCTVNLNGSTCHVKEWFTIHNTGETPAKLLNRHWVITDSNGKVQEVRGEGVVGEQPHLDPGEQFRYTSGTVIETPFGSMEGEYEMLSDNGDHFLASIPPFSLAMPQVVLH